MSGVLIILYNDCIKFVILGEHRHVIVHHHNHLAEGAAEHIHFYAVSLVHEHGPVHAQRRC
jgi:hypothetical protein